MRRLRLCLTLAVAVGTVGCAKEKINCGHGFTVGRLSYEFVDGRGLDWLARPGAPPLDSLRRYNAKDRVRVERPAQRVRIGGYQLDESGVPDGGGDRLYTQFPRLSATDTDTVEVLVHFGPLNNSECQRFHSYKAIEIRYNGRPAGSFVGDAARVYSADWGLVVTLTKIP